MRIAVVLLALFWMAQGVIAVLFKHGSNEPERWWLFFVVGNVVGVSSAVLWMAALRRGSANIVTGLAVGGAFLAQQIALLLVFHGRLTVVQAAGVAAIVGGMLCLGFGARAKRPVRAEQGETEAASF